VTEPAVGHGDLVPDAPGASEIVAWFGRWPSFHDAEVLTLHLVRRGESHLDLHTWGLGQLDGKTGRFQRERECVVRIVLMEVVDLQLADFSVQNVIFGLGVWRDHEGWRVELSPCYGLAGWVRCRSVRFSFTEGPPGSASGESGAT
jgi:hypothetical protein